jgi:hypothetical protein
MTAQMMSPANLTYKSRCAGLSMYVKLQDVVAQASGQTWTTYFNTA